MALETAAPDIWDQLFRPLRKVLLGSISRHYPALASSAHEVADEVIARLHEHFEFKQLDGLTEDERCRRFFKYLKVTVRSVANEALRRSTGPRATPPSSAVRSRNAITGEVIQNAFRELTSDEQELLTLKVINGWTYEEIEEHYRQRDGTHTTIGRSALKMRVLRALDQMRRRLSNP